MIYEPFDLKIEDYDLPEIKGSEALIRIRASGICGSDVNCYAGKTYEATFPYVPGHEWSGDVVKVGPDVMSLKEGDRVVGETVVGCGYCDRCKLGINPNFCGSSSNLRISNAFARRIFSVCGTQRKDPPQNSRGHDF